MKYVDKSYDRTHRCLFSTTAGVSIRHYPKDNWHAGWNVIVWCPDFDWGVYLGRHAEGIAFCPYCGERLEEEHGTD